MLSLSPHSTNPFSTAMVVLLAELMADCCNASFKDVAKHKQPSDYSCILKKPDRRGPFKTASSFFNSLLLPYTLYLVCKLEELLFHALHPCQLQQLCQRWNCPCSLLPCLRLAPCRDTVHPFWGTQSCQCCSRAGHRLGSAAQQLQGFLSQVEWKLCGGCRVQQAGQRLPNHLCIHLPLCAECSRGRTQGCRHKCTSRHWDPPCLSRLAELLSPLSWT